MRRGGHRGAPENPAGEVQFLAAGDDDYQYFRRLARAQGVEAAVQGFTKEELLKIMRANGFTYINPRYRKVDLGYALMGDA